MSEDLSDLINNVKSMMDNGNIPDNMKDILNSISSSNPKGSNTSTSFTSSSGKNQSSLNIDVETIIKLKGIIDNINSKDDPRANLLYSLKPYLRDSRKAKLDQYVNLLNMTKIVDLLNNEKKENNGNV
ncbi:MAG: hypothetical protein IKF17_00575 [Clostridia bacterium]|nr:hypothetical protein [Clostridia bacterium]